MLTQEQQDSISLSIEEGGDKKPSKLASFASSTDRPNVEEILSKVGSEEQSQEIFVVANKQIRHMALGYNEVKYILFSNSHLGATQIK